ncbi:MAG: 2-dehydro-3-deoxygalactonokinase [Alphaproteobacteria bacterium]|nr:2-dehydro-3-deoxygalactonokinase [Alphaproteobacteria bacterium]MCB9929529.1 2-dehydro-3-deoxygalactonokinase [Alphaproteobacteria bacterium]
MRQGAPCAANRPDPAWIAVDWGTSALRVWAMPEDGPPLAAARSAQGMASLDRDGFEPALLALIAPWLTAGRTVPVVACGMVGARQGWVEAPYTPVPCPPLAAERCVTAPTADPRLAVRIVPGLMQGTPPDVMRGEETQVAGFLADAPEFSGTLCLPGTHAKWVEVRERRVERFRTAMTGELFALLAERSVLRHSVGEGWDRDAFLAAVREAHAEPASLPGRLFGLRAGSLLHGLDPAVARARLSGWLIGAEIAAMAPDRSTPITVLGQQPLASHYVAALRATAHAARAVDAAGATLRGLRAAYRGLREGGA